ncbi:EamA family transporter [Arthrobacter crystallopoietes]|nr:EamA family transporter [Arthrobacter crystallopoietes]
MPVKPLTETLTPLVLVAVAVTVLAWASAFIVIRGVGTDFTPGSLTLLRLGVGAAVLAIGLIGRAWVKPSPREWLLIIGCGVMWFGVYNVALNTAEQTLDGGTTAMIVNFAPILIALGAGVFLREGIPKWLAIGAGVAFIGVLLIGFGTSADSAAGSGTGVIWALVAALTYSVGVLLQKPALRRVPAAQVTWLACAIGVVTALPFTGELIVDLQDASSASILGVVYLGVVPTALAFSTWGYALTKMPAGQLIVSSYLVPPAAIVLGLLFLGEVPTLIAVVGGAVCLFGVALSRRRSAEPRIRDQTS